VDHFTHAPPERRTIASMRVSPVRRPAKPLMRWKRVADVTRMRTVPRSLSRSRNVRALRSTETIVPSKCRAAAVRFAAGG
jgi:hypothetical protein